MVSITDAAREFGISVPTLYRHLAAGRLTRYKRPTGVTRLFLDKREIRKLLEPKAVSRRR